MGSSSANPLFRLTFSQRIRTYLDYDCILRQYSCDKPISQKLISLLYYMFIIPSSAFVLCNSSTTPVPNQMSLLKLLFKTHMPIEIINETPAPDPDPVSANDAEDH